MEPPAVLKMDIHPAVLSACEPGLEQASSILDKYWSIDFTFIPNWSCMEQAFTYMLNNRSSRLPSYLTGAGAGFLHTQQVLEQTSFITA